jgi:hypothetical protein
MRALHEPGPSRRLYARPVTTASDIQAAVDELASGLGLSVLVEDGRHQPLWWSVQNAVDGTRMRTILQRTVDPAAVAMVRRLKLAQATVPVHTPAVPEAEMLPRWCVPMHHGSRLLGYLWVLDADGIVTEADLAQITECAQRAAAYLSHTAEQADDRARQRDALLQRLEQGPDSIALRDLIGLERLDPDPVVAVDAPDRTGGWVRPGNVSVHIVAPTHVGATSGRPLPLLDLRTAIQRAVTTRRVIAAGALLASPTWDDLGAWHLIVDAPPEVNPADLHPGADTLAALPRTDLIDTARTVLELGGDVTRAAADLHIHRTTLYYRLDRIATLTGVDLRTSPDRLDLHMALRLAAYRRAG